MKELLDHLILLEKQHQLLFWIVAVGLVVAVIVVIVVVRQRLIASSTDTGLIETETVNGEEKEKKHNGSIDSKDNENREPQEIDTTKLTPKAGQNETVQSVGFDDKEARGNNSENDNSDKDKKSSVEKTDENVYVNYTCNLPEQIDAHPVFRFPKKGCIVRSYRIGRSKRRGYKEQSFQNSIELHFGGQFQVSGELRLNIDKSTKPFEPDIALIAKFNEALRIDIEIDEPYAGITRQPTHCKGDDLHRDTFFTDRGWIVIRFSEYQVHIHEKECLAYLASIVTSVHPSFQVPKELLEYEVLQSTKLWDIVQAQKWERAKYREEYLNHQFIWVEEDIQPVDQALDVREIEEEKKVIPTSVGSKEERIQIGYNQLNAHPRDSRIVFYPDQHVYTIDGTPYPSVSTIVSRFFDEFDPDAAIEKMRNGAFWGPNHKYWGMTDGEIKKRWEDDGIASALAGSLLHEQIEKYYLDEQFSHTEEFHLFEQFVDDHNDLKPFRSEWRIFHEGRHIAGTIDMLAISNSGIEMYDWKCSKKVVSADGNPITDDGWGRMGIGGLSDVHDTSYNRYCLQQSLYRYILESKYGLQITNMYLVVLHNQYSTYHKVEVPYWRSRAEYILSSL